MNYIKLSAPLCCLLLLALLAACGSNPKKNVAASGPVKPEVPAAAAGDYQQVWVAVDAKDWLLAESLLQDMQRQYPQLLSLPATLGWVYWQQQKTVQAEEVLLPLTNKPALYKPDAYKTLALIYREQGRFARAQELYQKSLGFWPEDASLHTNLGILYDLYLGQPQQALDHYRKARELSAEKNKTLEGWIKDLERRL